jgi:hypothetical protein
MACPLLGLALGVYITLLGTTALLGTALGIMV